ncbi:Myristoyl-CoA:protein N-myristoyltransferase, N-terminal domain-containing protein [Jimgerdemannia flammicorona]|uniref:Glycylpeptide N-tetradecanoyltransferase n=1 Tax=Jimgerdemannia flammicorona TaxID=994334 RepID=A0A433D159_9FUNG|nr:Myristoyl-CoA:protein N-myristoyltransferase, N-terminal domain-containing protein [Jimgerdemannia flammicorona]
MADQNPSSKKKSKAGKNKKAIAPAADAAPQTPEEKLELQTQLATVLQNLKQHAAGTEAWCVGLWGQEERTPERGREEWGAGSMVLVGSMIGCRIEVNEHSDRATRTPPRRRVNLAIQVTLSLLYFRSTHPPSHLTDETIVDEGPIEADIPHDQIRKEPYPLPKEFEWCEVDITDGAEIKELYELLTNNYVEDDDAMFRFDYSAPFLK